ncbi:MAG: insulinase family protein [Leptospiraceae bacterium]|nr:insulinase family protein [Leptospiraceae bacterium]MCP5512396.1 insulinase family protein [Leptospiraceae bacterium]
MKRFLIFLIPILILGLAADPGDFVRDIAIKELNFEVPEVSKEEIAPGIMYYHDENGEFPIVYLDIHFYGGESTLGDLPLETSSLLADTLKYGGSKDLMDEALVSRLEALGASLSISPGYESFSISVSFMTKNQEEVCSLLGDLISSPSFSEKAFENSKKKMIEAIKRRNERTESVGFRKIREVIFRNFKRSMPPMEDSVNKVSTEDLKTHFHDLLKNRNKSVVVSGKLDEPGMRDWVTATLAANASDEEKKSDTLIPAEVISLEDLKKNFTEDKRNQFFIEKDVNQSMLIYAGLIPPHNHPDFFAIQILNYIVGGGGFNSYMMQKIREEKGLAYSAASVPRFEKKFGVLYFYTLTKNDSLKEADQILRTILSAETIDKITEKEVEDAKNAIVNQFVFLFTNRHAVLSNQLTFDEDDMPEDYLQTYRRKMFDVQLKDVKRVGAEYFYKEKLKSLIVSSKANLDKHYPGEKKILQPEDSILPPEK